MTAAEVQARIETAMQAAAGRYHRLVLLSGEPDDVEATLRALARRTGVPLLDVSRTLAEALLELSARDRVLRAPHLLEQMVAGAGDEPVVLARLELLFEPSLRQEPLRLLEQLSRERVLVAHWPGALQGDDLVYADPGHPEHRSVPLGDHLAVTI